MAQVPYSPTQTVAPTETGTQSYLNVSATPASFGGLIGAAEQHLGGTEEQAGQALSENALRVQDYNNKQDAQTADMAFQAKATQKYSAYSSLEGKAAVDAYPGFQKDLMATVDEIASTMKSPMAQQAFKTSAQFSANRMLLQSSVYAAQQQKRSWMETNKAQNEVLTQGGILQQNDPVTLLKNEGQIMTNAVGNLIHEDPAASQDQINATKLSAAGTYWHAVITARMLTPTEQGGGAQAAQSLFNQVKERMDPRSILEVEQKLKPVILDQDAENGVGGILRGLGYQSGTPGASGSTSRDNNVGNIKASNVSWQGKGSPDGAFETFDTPEHGVAAAVQNLRSYATQNGGQISLLAAISKWAPAADRNDPSSYAAQVSRETGIGLNDPVPVNDPAKMASLVKSMTKIEKGGVKFGDDVFQRGTDMAMGGTASAGGEGMATAQGWRMPDWSKAEQQVLDATEGNSEARMHWLSKLAQTRSRVELATATERTNLTHQFEDLTKAAEAGLPVAVPEDRIRAVFPPDTADFYISRLNVAKGAGQILSGIKWGTPDQVQNVAEGLRTGTGMVSDMIREKLGTQKGAGTVTTPVGPGQPTATVESPEQFGMRQQIAAKARQQIEERAKLLTADPAGYVLTEPSVAAAAQGMDAKTREDPTDPTSGSKGYAAFARSALAVQDHLGVPEGAQHVLTEHMAQDMVQSLMKPGADVKQELDALKSSWGDETWRKNIWPDLVTLGKMPTAYQGVVELTNDPKNAALLARAIQEQSKTGKEWDDLLGKTSSGKLVAQGIRDDIRGNPSIGVMEQSLVNSGATAAQADSMLHSIYTLGYAKKFYEQDGNPGQSAADAFTNRYQFYTSGRARIPRDRYDDVTANADVAVEGLNQQNIIIRPGFRVEGASPDARRGRTDPSAEDFVNSIKANPIWTTSPRGDALWLRDNQFNIVYGQDRKPISVPYSAKAPVNPAHLRYGDPMQYAPVGSNF